MVIGISSDLKTSSALFVFQNVPLSQGIPARPHSARQQSAINGVLLADR